MPDLFSGIMTSETEKYGDFVKGVGLTPILSDPFIVYADVVNGKTLTLTQLTTTLMTDQGLTTLFLLP